MSKKYNKRQDRNHGESLDYTSDSKIEARDVTILKYYRTVSGNHSLPADKQYWTISNLCNINGKIKLNCELDQLLKRGLITPDQFYGVDCVKDIVDANRQLPVNVGGWICNDFLSAMEEADYDHKFNPAIINFDSITMTKKTVRYVADILYFLKEFDYRNVMIVCNSILRLRHYGTDSTEFNYNINLLDAMSGFTTGQFVLSDSQLHVSKSCYVYNGSGVKKGNTKMGTVCFWRV